MRQKCVCCVVTSVPPSQVVVSVKSTIVLNVLTPTLVGPMLFVKYDTNNIELLNSQLLPYYATCFVGKVCSPTWSTWGASP